MKQNIKRLLVIACVCICLAGGSSYALGIFSSTREKTVMVTEEEYALLEKYRRLEDIQYVIDQKFLWEYDADKLMEGAAQGMLGVLGDDYTFYYTPDQMEKENETLTGEYGGLGIEVFPNAKDDTITIRRVFYGGPAQQAGIRASDKIVRVDGTEVRSGDINLAVEIMRGEIGEKVTLTILRDTEIFDVELERALVQTEIIKYEMLENDIGYMRVFYFEGNLMSQFEAARKEFEEKGIRGIILDLRENPGGLVNLAVDLVDVFQNDEPIYHSEDKYGRKLTAYGREGAWEIPVVVLIDGQSASASEIVAAALQENGIAKVVGMQSYGKGIMQSVYPFTTDGAGMQITSDYWLTPKENNIHEIGVTPDIRVSLDEEAIDDNHEFVLEKDNQLKWGIYMLEQMLAEQN